MSEFVSTAPQEFGQRVRTRPGRPTSCQSLRNIALLLACTFVVASGMSAFADTHYVSKTGSNTSPYTSWATATDSVRAAIDAADEWDTVRVGPGEFTADSLPLKRGLAFIGSGMDSTHILHNGTDAYLIILADSCLVQGFHLSGIVDTMPSGMLIYGLMYGVLARADVSGVVRYNRLADVEYAIYIIGTDRVAPFKRVVVEANVLSSFSGGISLWDASAVIRNNRLIVDNESSSTTMLQQFAAQAVIEKNAIIRSGPYVGNLIRLEQVYDVAVRNNLCISSPNAQGVGIAVNPTDPGFPSVGEITNNLAMGAQVGIMSKGGGLVIRSNIIANTTFSDLSYDSAQTTPESVGFNLFWNNTGRPVDSAARLAAGCIFADPMFVDSIDFHLQALSPAIDAGDTLLLDPDGSRSDIGPYGGPLGETYTYVDLPPKTPDGVSGQPSDTAIILTWRGNHEADFDKYELYRDTAPIPVPDSGHLLAVINLDSQYVDQAVTAGVTYYYRIRAVDLQENSSALSNEVFFVAAGIDDHSSVIPTRIELLPNYPNPFNSSTRIPFAIGACGIRSYSLVRVTVCDVMGRHIRTLWRGILPAGSHDVVWDGMDERGQSAASGVYFVTLTILENSTSRKVLLLK